MVHATPHSALALLALSLSASAGATDYFLRRDGDDAADGRSREQAWRSLARVPTAELRPGDRILLEAGEVFHGSLHLTVSGDPQRPITVAPLGPGRATIAPPPGYDGILIEDAGHLVIRDMVVRGPGTAAADRGRGVHLLAKSRRSSGIVLSRVACHDFPLRGIELSSTAVGAGFTDVLVERVLCTGSGEGGMGSWGPVSGEHYSFHRVVVRDSWFHGNRGLPNKRDNHSGNGIILGDCQDSLIERCAAWGNGDLCRSTGGGPVGIWLCESTRSVIRGCLSYRNRTGPGVPDGGGFDLDGGCTGCVIEDSLSWRNDGAGYLICQYPQARRLDGNVIRNCWSVGDGLAKNNGAVYAAGAIGSNLVSHCTLIVDPTPTQAAGWRMAYFDGHLSARNNLTIGIGGASLHQDPALPGLTFGGNRWYPGTGFTCPAADAQAAAGPDALPPSIDTDWLRQVPVPAGNPTPIDPRWTEVLRAAGCDPAMPTAIGAVTLRRYGPAPE